MTERHAAPTTRDTAPLDAAGLDRLTRFAAGAALVDAWPDTGGWPLPNLAIARADVSALLATVASLTAERNAERAATMRVLARVSCESGEPRPDADPWLVALLGDYVCERARLRDPRLPYRADGPLVGWDAALAPSAPNASAGAESCNPAPGSQGGVQSDTAAPARQDGAAEVTRG